MQRFDSPNGVHITDSELQRLIEKGDGRPPRHKPGEKFLKGPIPWSWLKQALKLPGKTIHVAILVWKESGCCKSKTIRFNLASGREIGISRSTVRRGLQSLQEAGLVEVVKLLGNVLK